MLSAASNWNLGTALPLAMIISATISNFHPLLTFCLGGPLPFTHSSAITPFFCKILTYQFSSGMLYTWAPPLRSSQSSRPLLSQKLAPLNRTYEPISVTLRHLLFPRSHSFAAVSLWLTKQLSWEKISLQMKVCASGDGGGVPPSGLLRACTCTVGCFPKITWINSAVMKNDGLAHTLVFLAELWLPALLFATILQGSESPGRLSVVITSVTLMFPKGCTGEASKDV